MAAQADARQPRRCKGTTRAGKPCRAAPLRGSDRCLAHSDEETRESTGFGGAQPGAGRPRLPRPHEVMRDRIEEDVDRILAPFFDALDNAVVVATYEGAVSASKVPDREARQRAAERLLDRVYGRPRQAVEHSGGGGGPIEHAIDLSALSDEDLDALERLTDRASKPR